MTFDIWSAVFGASGLGVLKLIFDVFKYYRDRKDKKETELKEFNDKKEVIDQLFYDLLTGAVKIQDIIEEVMREIGAARIMIVKVENGGGVPQLGAVQTMTVLNESINRAYTPPAGLVTPIKQDIQAYTIDRDYQKLLLKVMENNGMWIYTPDDLKYSVFGKLYASQGIQKSLILHLTNLPALGNDPTKGFFIFMSVQFTSDVELTPKIESEYAIAQEKIKNIYLSFYSKRLKNLK